VKNSTKQSIDNYVKHGFHPGDFVHAVLLNDLSEAFHHADCENSRDMKEIIQYVRDTVPMVAWCSINNIKRWIKAGGTAGLDKAESLDRIRNCSTT